MWCTMVVSDLCNVQWQCLTCVMYNGGVCPSWCTMVVSDLHGGQWAVFDLVSVQWRCLTCVV